MCSVKKVFLEISQNAQENTCIKVSFFRRLAQVFSWEFWGISKNTFFTEYLRETVSVINMYGTIYVLYCTTYQISKMKLLGKIVNGWNRFSETAETTSQ